MMIELREYQSRTFDEVKRLALLGYRRILVTMPTGSGKTYTMASIVSNSIEKGNKTLSIMHRRGLVEQMIERYKDFSLDPGCIMAGKEYELNKQCQVASLFTYSRRLKLKELGLNKFWVDAPVVLVDEAHHIMSKTYQNILSHYKDSFVIGFTATPILASGVGLGNYFDSIVNVVTMDELLKEGNLIPGEYYGPSEIDLSRLRVVQGDYEKKALDEKFNKPKIIGDEIDNWFELASDKQTMFFAINRKHGKNICSELIKRGVNAEYLDAYSDDEERSDVINRFVNGDTQVISQVALYLEGTDIPEIECLAIARPTKSLGLHRQILGRGARPDNGKKSFMVLDFGGNVKRLGYYEDEIPWTLSTKKINTNDSIRKKREKIILTCEECMFLFTGSRCPQCGLEVKNYGKKIAKIEAELIPLRKNKKLELTIEEKIKFYQMLEYYRRKKGYKDGWSFHKYKERFGVEPHHSIKDFGILEPDKPFKNWIRHLNIKWAKSKTNPKRQEAFV